MAVRQLRNSGGEVLRRVEHGERIVITRDGRPATELRPLPRSSAGSAELIRRRKNLPQVDPGCSPARHRQSDRPVAVTEAQNRGMLDTSTVILLGQISDPTELPDESVAR